MSKPPSKLKRYTCVECGQIELRRGGGIDFTCEPCLRKNPLKHWKLKEILCGQRESARAVSEAVRFGELPRPSALQCVDCSAPAVEYDHRDYRKPLMVDPVCRKCNRRRGHAIPLDGFIQDAFALGIVPYGRKSHLSNLLERMGIHAPELSEMPALLDQSHWSVLIGHFRPTKEAEHA